MKGGFLEIKILENTYKRENASRLKESISLLVFKLYHSRIYKSIDFRENRRNGLEQFEEFSSRFRRDFRYSLSCWKDSVGIFPTLT